MRCWGRLLREYFRYFFCGFGRDLCVCGLLTGADVDFRYCAVLVVFMGNMPD
jgi:hypothetical protein